MSVLVGAISSENLAAAALCWRCAGVLREKSVLRWCFSINARAWAGTRRGRDDSRVDLERCVFSTSRCTRRTLCIPTSALAGFVAEGDLLIGACSCRAKAPKLISREMLRHMRPGSVLVTSRLIRAAAPRRRAPPPSRSGLCGGRRDALLRRQHAGAYARTVRRRSRT